METLGWLLWWGIVIAAGWQARKAWGSGTGIGAVLGLYLLSFLPLGSLLTLGLAVAVGARAEAEQRNALRVWQP
jgi:hypothetical protein